MRNRNPLSNMTNEQRSKKYNDDLAHNIDTRAIDENGKSRLLKLTNIDTVEFIAGLWRIQNDVELKPVTVRKKEFLMGKKFTKQELAKQEIQFFDYYHASSFIFNCYGPIIAHNDHVLANFQDEWSYGHNISQARAYLAVKLLDKYALPFQEMMNNQRNGNPGK